MKDKMLEIKKNDVFHFRWNQEYRESHFGPDHCFEGLLVVREDYRDSSKLILEDTYWSSVNNTWFTLEDAQKKGTLEFTYNLDAVTAIQPYETVYYDDKDVFLFTRQHSHSKQYLLRNSAKRSKGKMISVLKKDISDRQSDIEYSLREIERNREKITQIENGNLDIYI